MNDDLIQTITEALPEGFEVGSVTHFGGTEGTIQITVRPIVPVVPAPADPAAAGQPQDEA